MDDQQLLPTDAPAASEPMAVPETPVETSAPDTSAWDAERAAMQAQLAQERQQREAYEAAMARQAIEAWQQAERDLPNQIANLDPDEAVRKTQEFYRQRESFLVQQAQTIQQQREMERRAAYADHLTREHGLTEADRNRILQAGMYDPNQMAYEAQRIQSERTTQSAEVAQLRRELDELRRGQQAQTIRQSGAWQTGGAGGMAPQAEVVKGSDDHLRQALGPLLQRWSQRP